MRVADFGNERHGGRQLHAAQSLKRMDQRTKRPARDGFLQYIVQPVAAVHQIMNPSLVFLIDELLVREVERLFRQPAPVRLAPDRLASKPPTVTQKETLQGRLGG
jgi:hypothetical protein